MASISPATVDRLLEPVRAHYNLSGRSYTRCGTSLKDLIPFRTFDEWEDCPPGHFHPDGGSEFINMGLVAYCNNPDHPIQLSRSRPGKKNDNCYVEQKNFDMIRKLLGYARYATPPVLATLNELYRVHGLLRNYFYPSQKLLQKVRQDSKVRKRYDRPPKPR